MEFKQYVKRFFIKGLIWIFIFWAIGEILHFFLKPEFKEPESYWKGLDPNKPVSEALFDYNTGQVTYRKYSKGDSTTSEFEYPDLEGEIDIETEIDLIID